MDRHSPDYAAALEAHLATRQALEDKADAEGSARWEYETFNEDLGGITYKEAGGLTIDGSLSDPRLVECVEKGVRRILNRVSKEGWEPIGPIDANSLARAGHVKLEGRFRESWKRMLSATSTVYDVTLFDVRVDCRRLRRNPYAGRSDCCKAELYPVRCTTCEARVGRCNACGRSYDAAGKRIRGAWPCGHNREL